MKSKGQPSPPLPSLDFEIVMARAKEAFGCQTYAELGRELGLSTSAYANRKRAGSIPFEPLLGMARSRSVSIGWLLFGEGEPGEGARGERTVPEVDAGKITVAFLETWRAFEGDNRERLKSVATMAQIAALLYNRALGVRAHEVGSFFREEAQQMARVAQILGGQQLAVAPPDKPFSDAGSKVSFTTNEGVVQTAESMTFAGPLISKVEKP